MDQQLLLIEKLRQQLVADILEKTDLSLGDFTIDISISFADDADDADDANDDFYQAAQKLNWQQDTHDDAVWHTSKKPESGETIVFGTPRQKD